MTRKDPIIEEIRKIRDAHAKSFNYDVIAMGRALMEEEKKSDRVFIAPPKPSAKHKKVEAK